MQDSNPAKSLVIHMYHATALGSGQPPSAVLIRLASRDTLINMSTCDRLRYATGHGPHCSEMSTFSYNLYKRQ